MDFFLYIVKWRVYFFTVISGFICMGNFPTCYAPSEVISYFLIIDCDMEIPYSFNVCVIFQWEHCSLCSSPFLFLLCLIFVVFLLYNVYILFWACDFLILIHNYVLFTFLMWYLVWIPCTTLSYLVLPIYLWFI